MGDRTEADDTLKIPIHCRYEGGLSTDMDRQEQTFLVSVRQFGCARNFLGEELSCRILLQEGLLFA